MIRAFDDVVAWFTKDDRLIAASIVRIGLGIVLLSVYVMHYQFRHFLWGPTGFVPHAPFVSFLDLRNAISLYALSESAALFELIFHVGLLVTALWTTGLFVRVTGILTYAFAFSLWERNGFILDGGDNILIVCLFYLLFARCGRYFTVTRTGERAPSQDLDHGPGVAGAWRRSAQFRYQLGTVLHNAAMVAIILNLGIVYLTSALNKVQGELWQSGVALYYILRVQEFTWPGVSQYVYQNSLLVVAFTYVTVLEQLAYPFMLLNKWTKRVSVFVVVQMHLGIALLMGLVTFSAVMITLQAPAFRDDEYLSAARSVRLGMARVAGWFRTVGRSLRHRLVPLPW